MCKTTPRLDFRNMVFRILLRNVLLVALLMGAGAGAASAAQPVRIVVLGDSLVAGYNIRSSEAFPAQLQAALRAKGHNVEVINAGVSGDTTSAGLERLQWAVPENADAVIVELGANDALRGLDPKAAKNNLDKIISTVKAQGAEVLLAGMAAPRNLGEPYVKTFDSMYSELAKTHDVLLYPFFLEGIAMNPALNLGDGMHPNPKGVTEITRRILPTVEKLIEKVRAKQAANSKG